MRKISLLLPVIVFSIGRAEAKARTRYRDSHLEQGGNLSWEGSISGLGRRFLFEKTALPKNLIDNLEKAIQFAFAQGATREISQKDLDHAHLLFWGEKHEAEWKPDAPDAMLLHTQEFVRYSDESRRKRNIFFGPDGELKVLPCEICTRHRDACTVVPLDLHMVGPIDVYFVQVDDIPKVELKGYEENIRAIGGKKILFGIPKFFWEN